MTCIRALRFTVSWIFRKDTVPGTDIAKVVGLDDYIFDISVTANRADCQSVLGIAREVAAVLDKPLKMPAPDYKQSDYKYENLDIKVEAQDLCPRYLGHGVRNITPASPRDGCAVIWLSAVSEASATWSISRTT